jgi:hypothetical protein
MHVPHSPDVHEILDRFPNPKEHEQPKEKAERPGHFVGTLIHKYVFHLLARRDRPKVDAVREKGCEADNEPECPALLARNTDV